MREILSSLIIPRKPLYIMFLWMCGTFICIDIRTAISNTLIYSSVSTRFLLIVFTSINWSSFADSYVFSIITSILICIDPYQHHSLLLADDLWLLYVMFFCCSVSKWLVASSWCGYHGSVWWWHCWLFQVYHKLLHQGWYLLLVISWEHTVNSAGRLYPHGCNLASHWRKLVFIWLE